MEATNRPIEHLDSRIYKEDPSSPFFRDPGVKIYPLANSGSCTAALLKCFLWHNRLDTYRVLMPDMFTKEKRSKIMSSIKSSGSKMELLMKAALEKNNISFVYQPKMFGKPDFLISKKIVIFCDSSFWHGRNWQQLKKRLPDVYWKKHIERNRKRDRVVNSALRTEGYIVIRCWDKEINRNIDKCIARIVKSMNKVTEVGASGKGI